MPVMNVPLCRPDVGDAELAAIADIFKTGQLSHGSSVGEFEKQFAAYIGVNHAVALNSCTSGLYLLCEYVRETFGEGEILVPSFTFSASVNAILSAGMEPGFIDVDWDTGNTNVEHIESQISANTKALMVVHYAGRPCDMPAIKALADKHNLFLIEDAAECLGATIDGKQAGSYGAGVFSFYSTKNMTTGEGGMITTSDAALADWCKLKTAHGVRKGSYMRHGVQRQWFRNAITPGQNFRLSNFQAAMGLVQLGKLDDMNRARAQVAKQYIEGLKDIVEIELPAWLPLGQHSWQMFSIKVSSHLRDDLLVSLMEKGVGASAHFDPPVHWQNICEDDVIMPVTEKLSLSVITLPISSVQTSAQTEFVIETVKATLKEVEERHYATVSA